ncbi:STAS domain-containing protein [Actinokineospora auranticolor]|uniref:Anti-anti-sigma factor n=1 Tax=Actinokineospora auranticolor TaxID=155976 RepID=A0A2S6GIX0_9PSEU|nr:STAS domain-containing protein [Actinokineospora auranticolor]PPK65101.1 anti-anti-sigma factor [Actinokineospora auranticolor]
MESNLLPFLLPDEIEARRGSGTLPRRKRSKTVSQVAPREGAFGGSALLRLTITWQTGASGAEMHIQISGALDTTAAPTLAEALARAQIDLRAVPSATGLVLDLRTVSSLDGAGANVIARAYATFAACGTSLRLVADSAAVTRPLALTGLDRIFDLYRAPHPEPGDSPAHAASPGTQRP